MQAKIAENPNHELECEQGKFIEKRKLSRKAQSVRTGPVVLNQEIEFQVLDWMHRRRNHEFLSTRSIIAKVLEINPEFKGVCVNKIP